MPTSRTFFFALKVFISALLITYLFRETSWSDAWRAAHGLSALSLLAGTLLLTAYFFSSGVRWLIIIRSLGSDMRTRDATSITFVAYFFNQFLPATVGADIVRMWQSARTGIGIPVAINSVVLERASNLICLAILAEAGLLLWNDGQLPAEILWGLGAVCLAALAIPLPLLFANRLPIGNIWPRAFNSAEKLARDSGLFFHSPVAVSLSSLALVAGQAAFALAAWTLAQALDIPLDLTSCLALMPAVVLVSSLPISIAGWGVREYAIVNLLGYAGVPAASALALSLTLGALSIIATLPGAALWLTLRRRPTDIVT
ncbi:MAG: flippase-like domain-containing protein [Xanthomonadales bacterium]|nr:flippase-like domain-containing protein [Xanthomonadales bacterium]